MRRLILVALLALLVGFAGGTVASSASLTADQQPADQQPNTTIESIEVDDDGQFLEVHLSNYAADTVHTSIPRDGPNAQLSSAEIGGSGWALIPLSYSSQSTFADGCGYVRDGNTTVQVFDQNHGIVDAQTINITAQVDTCEGNQ